jgi:hypothetical protein
VLPVFAIGYHVFIAIKNCPGLVDSLFPTIFILDILTFFYRPIDNAAGVCLACCIDNSNLEGLEPTMLADASDRPFLRFWEIWAGRRAILIINEPHLFSGELAYDKFQKGLSDSSYGN